MFISVTVRKLDVLEDGYFAKFYIGSVCIKCASGIRKGSTSKRLCMVL